MGLTTPADYPALDPAPSQAEIDAAELVVATRMGRTLGWGDGTTGYVTPTEPLGEDAVDLIWQLTRRSDRILLPFGPMVGAVTVTVGGYARTDLQVRPWTICFDELVSPGYDIQVQGTTGWADAASVPVEVKHAIGTQILLRRESQTGRAMASRRIGDYAESFFAGAGMDRSDAAILLALGEWARPHGGFA